MYILDRYVLVRVDRVYPIVDTKIDRVYPIVAATTAILFTRRKTLGFTAFLWKTPRPRGPRPIRAPRSHATGRPVQISPRRPAEPPPAARQAAIQPVSDLHPDSLHSRASQGATRLLRFAPALRVTRAHRYGSERQFGPAVVRRPVSTGPTRGDDEGRTYSLMRRSCDGGIRGGDGSMTSPPVTVR